MSGLDRIRGQAGLAGVVCACSFSLLQPACSDASGPDYGAGASSITAEDMRGWIGALSHDSMRGRWTPSPEIDKAAATIAAYLQRLGLEAPFDGGFLQRYPVIEVDSQPPYPEAPNVAAVLRGSDPGLRHEYVLLVAHMDHVGTRATGGWRCTPVGADSLCNGADDNASGTAGILEIAEALSLLRVAPRRSILLLLTSGEEHGMHGALHFIAHSPVPMEQVVAAVSLDMISRNAPDTIAAIGLPYTTLGGTLQSQALAHPELGLDVVGDLWPGSNLYYRSDHIRFAEVGVPALFIFSGPTPETHTAANVVELVDADKAARVTRLAFFLACALGEQPSRPAWLHAPDPPT